MTIGTSTTLPELPLTCLNTAEFKSTKEAFKGKNTVIDFWTTKCVRCPAALDKLDSMATQPEYQNVEFTSIVLDECDGARNIIEQDDEPRWQNINHFYMDKEFKETAKEALGFNQVPFYVVLNEKGEIVQKGSKKNIDFDEVPGIVRPEPEDKENVAPRSNEAKVEEVVQQMHVFTLEADDW
ncbi:hypothetical protein CTEN210_03404 [Chaetoceros tenuissimus]|uniref:Thioredoxin domain-containing protein n=1 Tax=Chaetoceros tenuissimus TaxID=426638 RepID=A0AAD3CKU1_9STRA|nr:hypothetical protein CTEN210_03404 [Chaetoceros tenuissimus]